jgi:ATP-binding cassette subfamily C protein CydC
MQYRGGDLLARIVEDIESLENLYVRVISPPLIAVIVALGVGTILARFDPRLAYSWLLFLALAGIGVPLLVHWLSRDAARRHVNRRAELSACLVDSLQGMADLLVYNQDHHQLSLIDRLSREMAAAQHHISRMNSLQSALVGMLANLAMWSVLVQAIPLVSSGRLDGVMLASLALLALSSFEAVYPLPMAALYLESNLQSARRLFGLVDAQPEVTDLGAPVPMPAWQPRAHLGEARREPVSTEMPTGRIHGAATETPLLEVRDLYFCYPPTSPDYPYGGQMEKGSRNQRAANLAGKALLCWVG